VGADCTGGRDGLCDGEVYIFQSQATGIIPSIYADATLKWETEGTLFGYAISGGEDVNGDGYADLLVGAVRESSGAGVERSRSCGLGLSVLRSAGRGPGVISRDIIRPWPHVTATRSPAPEGC